jgi:hypothetical protein
MWVLRHRPAQARFLIAPYGPDGLASRSLGQGRTDARQVVPAVP